jgi:hypothetical protein
MKVSCGGLISLTIVSIVVVAIGVVILAHPKKINRIAPQHDPENSVNNTHLTMRHNNNT